MLENVGDVGVELYLFKCHYMIVEYFLLPDDTVLVVELRVTYKSW